MLLSGSALELQERPDLRVQGAATLLNTVPSAAGALVRLGCVPAGIVRINLAGEPLPRDLVEKLYAAGVRGGVQPLRPVGDDDLFNGRLHCPGWFGPPGDRPAYCEYPRLRAGPAAVAAADRHSWRAVSGRFGSRERLSGQAGSDGGALLARPIRALRGSRSWRAPVPNRRSSPLASKRHARVPGSHGPAAQAEGLSNRAGRDRGRTRSASRGSDSRREPEGGRIG